MAASVFGYEMVRQGLSSKKRQARTERDMSDLQAVQIAHYIAFEHFQLNRGQLPNGFEGSTWNGHIFSMLRAWGGTT